MTREERDRLRALREGIALPWSAVEHYEDGESLGRVSILFDGGDYEDDEVARIDMGHDVECDEAHAALIVGAVNALKPLCDALDAAEARIAALEVLAAGRTTPPTDAQVDAHRVAGGSWWWCEDVPGGHTAGSAWTLGEVHRIARHYPRARWWARDRRGVDCAWPEVKP